MKVRFHVFVSGDVIDVGFRSYTVRAAETLGVTGWVRNTSDGRVEAVVEGEEEKVRDMIEFLERGSPRSRVERVDVEREDYRGEFWDFRRR